MKTTGRLEREVARLSSLISWFEGILGEYPGNMAYYEKLAKLRSERAELAATIGRKRGAR